MNENNMHRTLQKKYQTLYKKVNRAIQNGRFEQYKNAKKAALLRRLSRYERRLLQKGIAVAGIAALMLNAAPLLQAQAPAQAGTEFRVNTTTINSQQNPSLAIDSDGDFVITWESQGQTGGDGYDIYAQRYDKFGNVVGDEFRVNTYTTNIQIKPRVAIDSDGDFVITWESLFQDGSGTGVYAQRYDKNGNALGGEFQVNTSTTDYQSSPSVAMDSDGDFVIAWQSFNQSGGSSYDVYAQRYDRHGGLVGNEFRVNTYTTSIQRFPSIAIDSDGDFVIAWESSGQDGGDLNDIYAQRYDKHGNTVGNEFRVNTYTTNLQRNPSVAVDSDGDFVIAWQSSGQDGSDYGTYAQRYNKDGTTDGTEFQVNTTTTNSQSLPSIAIDNDGDFVIAWKSLGQDGSGYGIYAQRYDRNGNTIGSEFLVNSFTTINQEDSSVAIDNDGDFVIAWQSNNQDGSNYGIYAQRYKNRPPFKSDEFRVNTTITYSQASPSVAADSDGDYVVVWESFGQDGDREGIYAQRYDRNGDTVGGEFQVNTYTTYYQKNPSVAIDSDGDFVIAWQSYGQDGSDYGIYAQRYDKNGNAVGGEFQVNTYTTSYQGNPKVAIDGDGNFVVVWDSLGQDGSGSGIYARRYTNSGNMLVAGTEFQVNTATTNGQSFPSIAVDNDGDFVIAWQSVGQDGDGYDTYAQRYDRNGNTLGSEFRVNTYTTSYQGNPRVAIDGDGDFVIAWQSLGQDGSRSGIYAQRYNKDGTTDGIEIRVNTRTTDNQISPSVAIDSDGDFVIAWQSYGQDGSGIGISAQRYSSSGNLVGSEFQVNSFTTDWQINPTVGIDNDGDFVIAWQSFGQDGSNYGVYARRYEDKELPLGSEFQVNETTSNNQQLPSIAVDSDGDYVIVWQGYNQTGGNANDIYAQRYNKDGSTNGSEFRVNSLTVGDQSNPSVAMDDNGAFTIVWESNDQVGGSTDIYVQRYDNSGNKIVNMEVLVNTFTTGSQSNPSVDVDSDGDFIVVWESIGQPGGSGNDIYAQRYNKDGTTNGAEFQVNTFTTSNQRFPNVGMDSDGDFVITWSGLGQNGSGYDIYAQRYTNSGSTLGAEFQVNTFTTNFQYESEVAVDSDGDFVIIWSGSGQGGSGFDIYARRYDNTGTPVEDQCLVNCYITGYQDVSSVGMDSDGDFIITWASGDQDGSSYGVYAQRYDKSGRLIGEEFQVNSFTSNRQSNPSIGVDSDGDFVIAWDSGVFSGSGQDGDALGIYAQRYQGNKSTTFCQTTLDLPNETITIDTKYEAAQTIISQQTLAAPDAIISYTAGTSITLKTGFHVQPGVNFTAKIAPVTCSSSLNEEVVESRTEEQAVVPTTEELSIALAPNPVSEVLQLQLDSQASGKATIQVIDLNGRIILSQALFLSAGQQTAQLDVSQLAAGTYFLKVQQAAGTAQSKFVKLQH